MPEGPEIRTAANFINLICESHSFSGQVIRGHLAVKLPLVNFSSENFTLRAEARGKELKVSLFLILLIVIRSDFESSYLKVKMHVQVYVSL